MKLDSETRTDESRFSEVVARARDVLRRRWPMLVLVAATIFILGTVVTFILPPKYDATARIQIDPSRNLMSQDQQKVDGLTPEAMDTEVSTFNSPAIAANVVRRLHLDLMEEFTKDIKSPSDAPLSQEDRITATATAVLKKLTVERDKLTYIITVTFRSRNADLSAKIANAFVDEYIASKTVVQTGSGQEQTAFIQGQLKTLGKELQEADGKVAEYRAAHNISASAGGPAGPDGSSGGAGQTIVEQQITPLAMQLAGARSDAAATNASLAAAEAQIKRGGRDSVAQVLDSAVIQDLRHQRAEVLRDLGDMETHYGDKYPELIKVREQLHSLDAQIAEQTTRVLASLQASAIAANARVASLQASMNDLSKRQSDGTRAAVLANSMQQEADAKRAQYNKLAQMSVEASQNSHNSIVNAEVLERAKPALEPAFPKIPLFIALSFVVGIVAGVGTIFTQEMLVSGIMTKDDLETFLNLPMLAAVPQVKKVKNPADLLIDKPTSLFSEAMRIARASILGTNPAESPQVIAITSALPAEGKSTTALALARVLAANGAKTLLIDCDIRRAVIRNMVRTAAPSVGLVEVLSGQASLEDAIYDGDVPGLSQLLATNPYFDMTDLFSDNRMSELLKTVRAHYTHVVLDLPPLIGLADGRLIAPLADATVLVVRWSQTPASAAASGLTYLRGSNVPVVGAILSMVDPQAEAAGAYYYSKKYSSYYQKA